MADASIKVALGASIPHILGASSVSIATGVFSSATSGASISALVGTNNLSSYPRCDVTLTYPPSATTSSTAMNIYLYRRDLNVDGVAAYDEEVPGTNNSNKFMGAFAVPTTLSTGTYYITLTDIPLPGGNTDCQFIIQNSLTNSLPAGWALTVTPKTDVGSTT